MQHVRTTNWKQCNQQATTTIARNAHHKSNYNNNKNFKNNKSPQ